MEEFFIADAQEEGVEVPLFRPDGTKSDHTITIYGHFSKTYQRVRGTVLREASGLKDLSGDERADAVALNQRKLTAALVKDWSFDIPLDEDSKMTFLEKAPQIALMIDRVAGDQSLFMKGSSRSSDPTPSGTPTSDLSQKDPSQQSANS